MVPHRDLLALPGALSLIIIAIPSRLVLGMIPLTLILHYEASIGALLRSGVALGLFGILSGLLAPLRGRLVDGHGTPAYLALGATCGGSLGALSLLNIDQLLPLIVSLVLCGLAGATTPPVSPVIRKRWSVLCRGTDNEPKTALGLDAVTEGAAFAVAPSAAGALVAMTSTQVGLASEAAVLVLSSVILGNRVISTSVKTANVKKTRPVLVRRSTIHAATVCACVGGTTGAVQLGVAALAVHALHPSYAGWLLTCVTVGGLIGGLMYAGTRIPLTVEAHILGLSVTLAAVTSALVLSASLPIAAVLLFSAGLVSIPLLTVSYIIVDAFEPEHRLTEAYAWLTTSYNLMVAAGAVIAGWAASRDDYRSGFLASAIFAAVGILVALLGTVNRNRLVNNDWNAERSPDDDPT